MVDVSAKILGAIGIVIVTITLLALTPTIVDQVAGLNTDAWDFTGHEGAEAMLGLVPFVWIASILIGAVVGMIQLSKTGGGRTRYVKSYWVHKKLLRWRTWP